MLLYSVPSSFRVHGDSSRGDSGRSLDSPEGQWSIGFQPVFCRTLSDVPRVETVGSDRGDALTESVITHVAS